MVFKILSRAKAFYRKRYSKRIETLDSYGVRFKTSCDIEKYRVTQYGGEKDALEYFLSLACSSKIIFDIGASVGLYSIITARTCPDSIIYSFEPDPETFSRLNENISLNQLKNINSLKIGCSDKYGEVELFTNGLNGFAPSLVRQINRKGAPEKSVVIKCDKIDNLITSNTILAPDLIKIDIEGAEVLCLRGAQKLLDGQFGNKPKNIFVEVHPEFLGDFESNINELSEIFKNNGYKCVWEEARDGQIHRHYKID